MKPLKAIAAAGFFLLLMAVSSELSAQEKLKVETSKPVMPSRTVEFRQQFLKNNQALTEISSPDKSQRVLIQKFSTSGTQLGMESASVPQTGIVGRDVQQPGVIQPGGLENKLPSLPTGIEGTEEASIPCDDSPIGTDDHYLTSSDRPLSVDAPGFLMNDIDQEGEALTATAILELPEHGSLAAFADGRFTYTPDPDFTGTDQFVYRMRDASSNSSLPITVFIEVTENANRGPVGTDDEFTGLANTTLSLDAPGFLANDIDQDGETITATAILDTPDNGSLAAFADGRFTYSPNADFTGTDQFVYRMRDASGNFSDPVTVTLNIIEGNRGPVGIDDVFGVVQNTALSISAPGFLANDSDPDGDALTATAILDTPDHGSIAAFADGRFTYVPDPGFTGTDQFVYRMRDASLNSSDPITVTLEVVAPGSLPIGFDDEYYTPNDRPLSLDAPGFLANDIDQNGEALTATAILDTPDNGSLAAFADGRFTYTPDPDFVGTDQFVYRMRDASNNFSEPVTVVIEVAPAANRNPVGTDDSYSAIEGVALSIASPGFLANDTDPDGEAITATAILDTPDNGSLAAFADGRFTYTPNPGFVGTDQFVYRMRDASNNFSEPIAVTIEVLPGNRQPVGVDDVFAVNINTPLSIDAKGFLANDFDPDEEDITATAILDTPDNGSLAAFADGRFTYTPDPDFTGTDQFIYRMRDASLNTSEPVTVTLFVIGPNQPPVAVAADLTVECEGLEGTTVTLDGSGSSDDRPGPLTYSWYQDGELIAGPTDSPESEVTLTPGDYELTLVVEDFCGESDSDVAEISVADTTDPEVTAAFAPSGLPFEYMISCSAEDACSETITTSSMIKLPDLISPAVSYNSDSYYEIEIDPAANQVEVTAPDPVAFWAMVSGMGGVSVEDGQMISAIRTENLYTYEFNSSGELESVSGSLITLVCTATDASGNTGSAEATLQLNVPEDLAVEGSFWTMKGTYRPTTWRQGRVQFSFDVNYVEKASEPRGTARVSFPKGPMYFRKDALIKFEQIGELFVLEGTGTVNNAGDYHFLIRYARDKNTIRIVISDAVSNELLYDNQYGDPLSADPSVPVSPYNSWFMADGTPRTELNGDDLDVTADDLQFSFYPNPVRDKLFVQIPEYGEEYEVQLRIVGLNGDILYEQNFPTGQISELDMTNFKSGLYLLQVLSENENKAYRLVKD